MEKLIITNKDHSYVKVHCSESIAWELRDSFSYRPKGFQFMPAYKIKVWDGFLRMFNVNNRTILRGMVSEVQKWATERGYECEYPDEPLDTNFSVVEAEEFITELNPKHNPRDYQVDGFVHGIRSKRKIILSPTGSGKSLLQYLLFIYLMKQGKRGLLIVPRSALVEQMYSDFEDYSSTNGKVMSNYCHKVYSGKEKHSDKPLVISTWQSLQRLPPSYFTQFDYVICDEVHGAVENKVSMKVITKIVTNCINAEYRIGVSGTLPDDKGAILSLKGLFGDIYKAVSTEELMKRNELAKLRIKCLLLKYSEEECKLMKTAPYQDEIRYIVSNKDRNLFIQNLALSLEGNTLILFNYVESHGKVLYEMINKKRDSVYFIHGGTDVEDRETIRKTFEQETGSIIVGSIGVLSTGTNIVSLDNIIFASPSKSKIRNLQSIGRALRVSDTKKRATVFDLADDFSWKKHENYSLKHFYERMKIYSEEKFWFKIYKIDMTNKKG